MTNHRPLSLIRSLFECFLLFTFSLATVIYPVFSQDKQTRQARVVLLNGNVLTGLVDEMVDGEMITLLLDGNSSVRVEIAFNQISTVEFSEENFPTTEKVKARETSDTGKIYFSASTGLLMGEHENNFTFGSESGYRFNEHWAFGIGASCDFYEKVTAVPVFANARYYLDKMKHATPYFFIGGGHGLSWFKEKSNDWNTSNERSKGGFYGHAGIGHQARVRNMSLAFVVGYRFQDAKREYDFSTSAIEEQRTFRRCFFSVAAVL